MLGVDFKLNEKLFFLSGSKIRNYIGNSIFLCIYVALLLKVLRLNDSEMFYCCCNCIKFKHLSDFNLLKNNYC